MEKNRELKENELERVSGGECIRTINGKFAGFLSYEDAPNEGIATYRDHLRCTLNVGGKSGTCIEAFTDDGVIISGIEADNSIDWDGDYDRIRFQKIDRDETGAPQYWFFKA